MTRATGSHTAASRDRRKTSLLAQQTCAPPGQVTRKRHAHVDPDVMSIRVCAALRRRLNSKRASDQSYATSDPAEKKTSTNDSTRASQPVIRVNLVNEQTNECNVGRSSAIHGHPPRNWWVPVVLKSPEDQAALAATLSVRFRCSRVVGA